MCNNFNKKMPASKKMCNFATVTNLNDMRKILTMLIVMAATAAMAQEYTHLVVVGNEGAKVKLADFNVIRFSDEQMTLAKNDDEVASFNLSGLKSMHFDIIETTLIESVPAHASTNSQHTFGIDGIRRKPGCELPKGLYIIKEGTRTRKVVKP